MMDNKLTHATATSLTQNSSNSGKKFLLIEDNIADARYLQLMLEDTTLDINTFVHCDNLKSGIDAYDDFFNIVFLDLTLPDSRGIETLERFLVAHPSSSVIVMTGFSDQQTGINAVKSGAQDFLIKGEYETDQLLRSIYYTIERNKILFRFEEAQRIAKIGSWEVDINTKEIFISDAMYAIFEVSHLGKKINYKTNPNVKSHSFFKLFAELHFETYDLYAKGNHEGLKKELLINTVKGEKILKVKCRISEFQNDLPIFYGLVQDISDLKKAEELERKQKLSEESVKLKEEFITNVSHEMRTPMNAILGMTNILLNTPITSEQNDCLSSIKQSSEMLLGIVNDILDFSSLQNGKVRYENSSFNLHELLTNLIDVMQYKVIQKDISIQSTTDKLPNCIISDKLRLNQVLFNLVGNAIKFTEKGFVKIHSKIISKSDDAIDLEFCVEDSGIGIPNDKLEVIFDSFARVLTKDKLYEGTGLGLAIAKNIIEQQGGKIWAESQVGIGSKFFFTQTFTIDHQNLCFSDSKSNTPTLNINLDFSFKLLLVEDNKLNQIVAKKTLEKQWKNINLTIADNGKIAIDILKDENFDIILMDIQMPVLDGYEATEYIRKHMPDRANIPILAMTAFAHISKEDKFKDFGMDDFVLKPFEPEDLYQKVAIYSQKL